MATNPRSLGTSCSSSSRFLPPSTPCYTDPTSPLPNDHSSNRRPSRPTIAQVTREDVSETTKLLSPHRTDQNGSENGDGEQTDNLCSTSDCDDIVTLQKVAKETGVVVRISIPLIIGYTLQQSIGVASIISLGHLGATELAAAALSSMFAGVSGYSVVYGLATALDTLCAQSVTGSSNQYAAGIWLQRGLVILMLCITPVIATWLHAESILLLLNQEPELARLSGLYMKCLAPGLIPVTIFECLKKYLQAQGIFHATTIVLLIASPINALANYALVWYPPLSLGFMGAPLATSMTQWLLPIFTILYILFVQGKEAWGGFSMKAFEGWPLFLRLGIPGMIMMCAEWWAWEIVALFASYLSVKELAAQSVVLTIGSWLYMMPLGVSIATTNRIGNQLGACMPNRARLASIAAGFLAVVFALVNSTILVTFKSQLIHIFSDDSRVAEVATQLLPIAAIFQVVDGLAGVGGGVLRGAGKQSVGAALSLTSYYIIALPVGVFLAFGIFDMRLPGIWIGLAVGLLFNAIMDILFILRINWREEVRRCMERVGSGAGTDDEVVAIRDEGESESLLEV